MANKSGVTYPIGKTLTYAYNAVGNRLTVAEIDGNIVSYSYDPTYQLASEKRSGPTAVNVSYTYDGLGNRLTRSDSGVVTNYAYNAANAMTLVTPSSGSPTTLSYDLDGNLTLENVGGTLTTYTWDGENRLITRSDPTNGILTSTYDATGLRSVLVTPTTTTYFVRDGQNILQESNSSYVTQAQYTDNPGDWNGLTSQRRSGVSSFYGFDLSSNTRLLTNSSGADLGTYLYDAFGIELSSSGSTTNSLRFGGQAGYWRDLSNWMYIRARYLSSLKGRWPSRDPIGFNAGDWNQYRYVGNDPVMKTDPSGLRPKCHQCGPDVTAPVREALQLTINSFWRWSDPTKHYQCYQLLDITGGGAFSAWDIEQLHYWAQNIRGIYNRRTDYPSCATSTGCEDSLQMNGTCWYAGDINYALFGVMMRICYDWTVRYTQEDPSNFEAYAMIEYIIAHKGRNPTRDAAIGWALSGYSNYATPPTPSSTVPDRTCQTGCAAWHSGTMDVNWLPRILPGMDS
jgi:RHS repeat-associated protein